MKLKVKLLALLFLIACQASFGQLKNYSYKRELKGITDQWHKITLPDDVFGKVLPGLNDIRIYGITSGNDTIEAPYEIRLTTEKISNKEVEFKTINIAQNQQGYYFTFDIPTSERINQIQFEFKQKNFDWRIRLEGSQDLKDWFTVVENYRILSIQNGMTDFQFTKLTFQDSKYRYYRLLVESTEKPQLESATITQSEVTEGTFRNYSVQKFSKSENKETGQTEIDVELEMPVPVSCLRLEISDSFDYYRPLEIKCLADSFRTEKGWRYNYKTLFSGTINSIEKNEFRFESTIAQKLKVLIHNHNNQPLTIDTLQVKGYIHELIARFTTPATYYLTYGNPNAINPQYDIERFIDKAPSTLSELMPGSEVSIDKEVRPATTPIFKNKAWLWTIMILIILLLGWFSVRMINKNTQP